MKVTDLLRFRARSLRRRLSGPVGLGVGLLSVGLLVLLVLVGGPSIAANDRTELEVRDGAFWFSTLTTLILSYTTFEVFFRAADQKAVAALPIPPGTRYWDLFIRALALHLPLLLLPLAYAYGLWDAGHGAGAAFAATYGVAMFVVGLPLAITIHLWAGKSLLTPGSDLRKILAGAAVSSDAAVLVYAPALALLVILVLGIFLDLFLRDALLRGQTQMLWPVLLAALGVSLLALRAGHRLAVSSLLKILPRFSEVDVPPPYREDGIRRHVPGERLARLLPASAVPYFLRDIRQLRRRYRLDRVLLVLYFAYLLNVVHGLPEGASPVGPALIALLVMSGALIVSAFRLGGELAAPALERVLPVDRRANLIGRLAATAIHPVLAALLTALAVATLGRPLPALLVLGAGLVLTVSTIVFPGWLAAAAGHDARRVTFFASAWRLLVLAGALILSGAII